MDSKNKNQLRKIIELAKDRNELIYAISPDYRGYIPLSGIIFPDYTSFTEEELIAMLDEEELVHYTKVIEINLKGEVDWKCELGHINPYVYIQANELDALIPASLIAQKNIFEKEKEKILSYILKEKFKQYKETIWSFEADMFVDWCVYENFENQSFKMFINWFKNNNYRSFLTNNWSFFYGYSSMVNFAKDWVAEDEKLRYFDFYREATLLKLHK